MKKVITIVLLLICSTFSFGQEIKRVIQKNSEKEYEVFHVLKSDENIKQGDYSLYYNQVLIENGNYNNNLKDGEWKNFKDGKLDQSTQYKNGVREGVIIIYYKSGSPKVSGNFSNNKRTGIWIKYNKNGSEIEKFDFTNDKVILANSDDSKSFPIILSDPYKGISTIDTPPLIGGDYTLTKKYLKENLKNHSSEKQGVVYLSFVVDIDGTVDDITILKSVSDECDKAAIELIKGSNQKWEPAIFNNKKVKARTLTPVLFMNSK